MVKRGILIFPRFENEDIINKLRKRHDASVDKVRPHITLVFPFESDIGSVELKEHIITALSGVKTFDLSLKGITFAEERDNHLYLNVYDGIEEIIDIHKKLYTGILEGFFPDFLKKVNFLPHMTIGNLIYDEKSEENLYEIKNFNEVFNCRINEIAVEYLTEDRTSIREFSVFLE